MLKGKPNGKLVEAMQHHEDLSFDGRKHSNGHVVARSGTGFRVIESVIHSLSPKLLGVFLIVQQFNTVAALRISAAVKDSSWSRLDLVGLISAFGTAAATRSLAYSALYENPYYLTGHIGPGSLSVAAVLFAATEINLARLLALGGTGDAYELLQLGCPDGLRYIGLKSYTDCSVTNAVGASIVREHDSVWKKTVQGESKAAKTKGNENRDEDEPMEKDTELGGKKEKEKSVEGGRQMKVIVLKVEKWPATEIKVCLTDSKGLIALAAGWVPLVLTLGLFIFSFCCKEWIVGGLILLGTVGMLVAVVGLRHCFVLKYSKLNPAKGLPNGDCVVIDERAPDVFHIIEAEEKSIQALFQNKIIVEANSGKYLLFVAGSMLYGYVIGSVLCMAAASPLGKILFTSANLVGLVADMYKASRDARLGLAKKARDQFKITCKRSVSFPKRSSAVAFVATFATECSMLKSKKLLPCDGPVWTNWWNSLGNRILEERNKLLDAETPAVAEIAEENQATIAQENQAILEEEMRKCMEEGLRAAFG